MKVYVQEAGANRHEMQLPDRAIGKGAAGNIYHVATAPFRDTAAKIYHDSGKLEMGRIEHMVANPPENAKMTIKGRQVPTIAWPTHLILDASGKAIGYLMPFVDASHAVTMQEYVEDIGALPEQDQSISLRLNVARNLAALLTELHSKRDYFIDLKPQNLLVFKETGSIAMLDCDGFAIGGGKFTAPQYSRQYQAPEVVINRASPQSLSLNDYHDRFAMAVVIFQILNYGIHPFQGVPTDMNLQSADTDEYIRQGWYAYPSSGNSNLKPHPNSIHTYWDGATLNLFQRTFMATKPSQRVSAKEWLNHFDRLLAQKPLVPCKSYPKDVRHIHFKGKTCFMCEKFMKAASSTKQTNPARAATTLHTHQPQSGLATGIPLPAKVLYASFWRRGIARVLDLLLLVVAGVLVGLILGIKDASWSLILHLYFPIMHSSKYQATLAKQWFGMRVVDDKGQSISPGRSFGRFLGSQLLILSYIFFFFTDKRQALHDKIAGTYVVYDGR